MILPQTVKLNIRIYPDMRFSPVAEQSSKDPKLRVLIQPSLQRIKITILVTCG